MPSAQAHCTTKTFAQYDTTIQAGISTKTEGRGRRQGNGFPGIQKNMRINRGIAAVDGNN